MLKFWGVVFLLAGAAGFSFCICRDRKKRLKLLKELKYMYELIQNEISYTIMPLPMVFQTVADKVKAPFGDMLRSIGFKMVSEEGSELKQIWEQEARKIFQEIPFTKEQKNALLRFPESMGLIDSKGQARVLQRKVEEAETWIAQQEKEGLEKEKVIMSLGMAGGILLVILLV